MNTETVKMSLFLDTCCEVESITAEMYYFLATHFRGERRIAQLWYKTAMEEEDHARQVVLARKMIQSISWVNLDSWRSAFLARKMIQQIATAVQKSPPSLPDALTLALHCEKRMDHLHMQNAILLKENAGNCMFKAMLQEDRGHIAMMEEALREEQQKLDIGFHASGLHPVSSLEMTCVQ